MAEPHRPQSGNTAFAFTAQGKRDAKSMSGALIAQGACALLEFDHD